MEQKLKKNGKTHVISIPKSILSRLGWVKGTSLRVKIHGDQLMISAPEMDRLLAEQIAELYARIAALEKKNL